MSSHDCHAAVPGSVCVRLTVPDILGVQRALTLLRARGHKIVSFAAQQTGSGLWQLSIGCAETAEAVGLLLHRLRRLPAVLTVDLVEDPVP